MIALFLSVTLGVFLGIGMTAFYLAISERNAKMSVDSWIDEAFERSLAAAEDKISIV